MQTYHSVQVPGELMPGVADTDDRTAAQDMDVTRSTASVAYSGEQESGDTSDEEVYLRRVSVLYHELWCSDWSEHQPASRHRPAAAATAKTLPPPPTAPTRPPAVPERPPATIASHDNGPGAEPNHPGNGGQAYHQTRRFPELQSSWGSLVDAYMEPSGSAAPGLRDRSAPVSSFSPSDLADALVGTICRLEDDCTLQQHKRWSVIKELATTEAHYLRDLLVLRAVFYEPLTGPSEIGLPGDSRSLERGLLRPLDAQIIFGNLDRVIDCARSLVEYLTVAVVYEAKQCCESDMEQAVHCRQDDIDPSSWQCPTRRPASQPEAARTSVGAKASNPALRKSAWADISVAQAFLLTSQRMECVYGQYCQNFETASRRIIELKRNAAASSATAPATPMTSYRQSASSSPFADHIRGWRHAHHPGSQTPGLNSPSAHSFTTAAPPDGADAAYCAAVYRIINEQAQLLSGKTTSWDLSSLLIKPVQRILKYPLLIRTLLGHTQTHTSDRSQLERAAQSVERIAEAINTVNRTNGLRISTATAASSLSAATDDSQGRLGRELRRVLRRKPGNASHMRSKSQSESFVKDKLRLSARSKIRAKDNLEHSWATAPSTLPSTGTEALIEQHEHRISGLIARLRQWERDIGTMLCQQVVVAARWRDLYSKIDDSLHPTATPVTTADRPHVPDAFSTTGGSSVGAGTCREALAPGNERRSAEELWESSRRTHASAYHAALDTAYRSLFPKTVCSALHSKVYPVLNSLLQVYSDGPRYILSEVSRASSNDSQTPPPSSSSAIDDSDGDSSRRLRLGNALVDELPRLFDYERVVIQLLLERVVRIQHDFYAQLVDLWAKASANMFGRLPEAVLDPGISFRMHRRPEAGTIEMVAAAAAAASHTDQGPLDSKDDIRSRSTSFQRDRAPASMPADAGPYTKASFDRRLGERIQIGSGTALPSASEHTCLIRTGLWQLAQEAQRNNPAQYAVKPRHRRGTVESAPQSETASDHSISFDEYSSVSVFGPASPGPPKPAATVSDIQVSSAPATHGRKKSGGFIGRIAHLKTTKAIRKSPSGILASFRPNDSDMGDIKPRPQLGLGIGVGRARSRSGLRAKSDADLRSRSNSSKSGWADMTKYEPLPSVDPIRFSKGFIDATFEMHSWQDLAGGKAPPAHGHEDK
ncbi:hypothetical protein GGF46_001544 [Coemansia sp. RSA 552]|nr:hypothetical protein GGF46_001544 [Coemansia sp. RSA 552]